MSDQDQDRDRELDAPAAAAKKAGRSDAGGGRPVLLGENVEIYPSQPLEDRAHGPLKAYEARNSQGKKCFALICEKSLVPRVSYAPNYASILNTSMAKLSASGVVDWPLSKDQRYVFVYEDAIGQPLTDNQDSVALGWRHDKVMQVFIKPMINVLLDLRDADLVHGSIRPSNLFNAGSEGDEKIILGECLSLPTAYAQPALLEPPERAMADPQGRGLSTFEDDMYAFGVTLACLMRGHDPLEGLTQREIFSAKLEQGSYAALTGKDRFTGAVLELLRGLLHDDVKQRWTIEEAQVWMDGRRLSPKQVSTLRGRAARPIRFNERKYIRPQLLGMDLPENPKEAMTLVESGELKQWLNRSVEDEEAEERVEQAVHSASEIGRGGGYTERVVSRVSQALFPGSPIAYMGVRVMPEGMGPALAHCLAKKQDPRPYADIILHQAVFHWANCQEESGVDIASLVSRFDSCKNYLKQQQMGFGLERCLYALTYDCPCLSEIFKNYYVRTPEDLLKALEDMVQKGTAPETLIDRHVAAFINARETKAIEPNLAELNAPEPYRKSMGVLRTIASLQKRAKMDDLPGVGQWLAGQLEPIIQRFHDKDLRDDLRKKVKKLAEKGSISKIGDLLDDNNTIQQDFRGFKQAMHEYAEISGEEEVLERRLNKTKNYGKRTGQEVAALVSGIIAAVIILAFTFIEFSNNGFSP